MSYEFYKVLHLAGIMALFLSLGAAALHSALGGTKGTNPRHKAIVAAHGVALAVILVAGFGMIAKLGVGFPGWVLVKLVIWLLLGAAIAPLSRWAGKGGTVAIGVFVLGALAAWLAVAKPF
ncbi:MAG: hypothetical protein H6698_06670 [Myxococcales bacterium]|nr:hypothetical protein [Myxococcales bacterium]MCB9533990.1 hypothetical protein [Myxococcales bacterium]